MVDAGGDIDALSLKGLTPLTFAMFANRPDIVALFVGRGASLLGGQAALTGASTVALQH